MQFCASAPSVLHLNGNIICHMRQIASKTFFLNKFTSYNYESHFRTSSTWHDCFKDILLGFYLFFNFALSYIWNLISKYSNKIHLLCFHWPSHYASSVYKWQWTSVCPPNKMLTMWTENLRSKSLFFKWKNWISLFGNGRVGHIFGFLNFVGFSLCLWHWLYFLGGFWADDDDHYTLAWRTAMKAKTKLALQN